MCTGRQFDRVFFELSIRKALSLDELIQLLHAEVSKTDILDAVNRLASLGFALKTRSLDGKIRLRFTNRGAKVFDTYRPDVLSSLSTH